MSKQNDPNIFYDIHNDLSRVDSRDVKNQHGEEGNSFIDFDTDSSFGQEQCFQSFDYTTNPGETSNWFDPSQQVFTLSNKPQTMQESSFTNFHQTSINSAQNSYNGQHSPNARSHNPLQPYKQTTDLFNDEPPLMEELGINVDHIYQKAVSVLNILNETDADIVLDTDLAGPLAFIMAFGGFLLLSGKIHFGYIYGVAMVGCLAIYCLLNLMAITGVSVGTTVSVLGYCLLPMVALSGISVLVSLQGVVGIGLTALAILWCSLSASKLFVTALALDHQQPLVAYPCALLYGVFALLTIF